MLLELFQEAISPKYILPSLSLHADLANHPGKKTQRHLCIYSGETQKEESTQNMTAFPIPITAAVLMGVRLNAYQYGII